MIVQKNEERCKMMNSKLRKEVRECKSVAGKILTDTEARCQSKVTMLT